MSVAETVQLPARPLVRPMSPRDPGEMHRSATPLELLFDLCFVVAVAEAARELHHGLAEGHVASAAFTYAMVFFTIWWAWMNFTWFASAYDSDDVAYRLKALLQIGGGLVIAAGTARAFEHGDFRIITAGFTILRIGMIAAWLRAARADRKGRTTALRYAVGLAACQCGWIALLALSGPSWLYGFALLAPAELLVPMWAESAGRTPWHAEHIAERYGLFTLIVLGESVVAASLAIQSAFAASSASFDLVLLGAGALVILFALWWEYFDEPAHAVLRTRRDAFLWGYGHLLIFAATAAVGAGLSVMADVARHDAHLSASSAGFTVAVPVAIFLLTIWALHVRRLEPGLRPTLSCFAATALVLAAGTAGRFAVPLIGVVLAIYLGESAWRAARRAS